MTTLQQVFLTALSLHFSKDGYFNSNKARCEEKRFLLVLWAKYQTNKQNKTIKYIYIYLECLYAFLRNCNHSKFFILVPYIEHPTELSKQKYDAYVSTDLHLKQFILLLLPAAV